MLAHHAKAAAHLNPSAAKEVEGLVKEIVELKATLRAEGLTERQQDKDERVLMRLVRLAELRQFTHHEKKHEKREQQDLGVLHKELLQLKGQLVVPSGRSGAGRTPA